MLLVHDIVFAKPAQRDKVLKAANHATKYRTFTDAGFSIDDVVTLLSLRRAVVNDRKQWFVLRREVYSSFKEDDTDVSRTIALLSTDIQDEVAGITDVEVAQLVQDWPEASLGLESRLRVFISACREAGIESLGVMIKSYSAVNAFEMAIKELPRSQRNEVRVAFDAWDAEQQKIAHEKFKFLKLIGQSECLATVCEEIEHGHSHCATLSFLTAVRKMVEAAIKQGIDGIDYLDQFDDDTTNAITKFKLALNNEEQARVLRAFSITLMSDIIGVVENGEAIDVPSSRTGWALIETTHTGQPTGKELGELHAHLDGSTEFWPDVHDR